MSLDDSDRESQDRLSGNRFEALSDRAEDSEREVVPVTHSQLTSCSSCAVPPGPISGCAL